MHKGTVDAGLIRRSVISVPPLCRDERLAPDVGEMKRLADHLASGDVTTLMYGGNAVFYHAGVSEYGALLDAIEESAPDDAWVIPSIGPDYGKMMDQVQILRGRDFPAAMVLPTLFPITEDGVVEGISRVAERLGKPVIAYVKNEGYLRPETAAKLLRDGVAAAVKYAIVRDDPSQDPFLDTLLQAVGSTERIISGIGERPVIDHWAMGLRAFTSGSVCIAPHLSTAIKHALEAGDTATAATLRRHFLPLEDLRDALSPIRVLHEAVDQAGIARTGPMLPLLTRLPEAEAGRVRDAAGTLLAQTTTPSQTAAE